MTKQAVQGYISDAARALSGGMCDLAGERITAGYQALQDYAQVLAVRGLSPAPTLKLQKQLAKLYSRRQQQCVTDSLIAPSFSGAGPFSRDNLFPTIGFIFATVGLAIGFGTIYKNS